jgi:hypothetical protein
MPTLLWLYLTALLYDRTSASCVALAEARQTVSQDRLTRLLQGDWSGQTLLEFACRTLFVWERGALILDDTGIPKPFAAMVESLSFGSGILLRSTIGSSPQPSGGHDAISPYPPPSR